MKYYASTEPPLGQPPPTLILEAESLESARAYAARVLGERGLVVQETGEDARADVVVASDGVALGFTERPK